MFVGPVLDEKIFRALVEKEPELSGALPRKFSERSLPADIQTKTAERYSRSSVVSLPLEKRSREEVNGFIGGTKATPPQDLRKGQ